MKIIYNQPNPIVKDTMRKMAACLKEAARPIAVMVLLKMKTYFLKEGDNSQNGKETKADT